jgi:hypothetical protein
VPGGYASYSGTSMAAPHVTGVVALLKSLSGGSSFATIKGAVLGGVDAVSSLSGKTVTGGRLNAFKAIGQLPVAIPPVPTGLGATATSSSQVNVAWADVAGESGYQLQCSTDPTFTTGVSTFNLSANVTSYADTGLSATTTYYYRLASVGTSANSAYVNAQATTLAVTPVAPVAPAWTSVVATTSTLKLNWTNVANETGYKVEKLVNRVWKQIATTGADVTTFTDTGLSSNKSLSYRVRAYNAAGNSAYSPTLNARTTKTGTKTTTFSVTTYSFVPSAAKSGGATSVWASLDENAWA